MFIFKDNFKVESIKLIPRILLSEQKSWYAIIRNIIEIRLHKLYHTTSL